MKHWGLKQMQRKISEAERARAQYAALASLYRPIGPAAIVAALLCAKKTEDAEGIKEAA